MVTRIRLFRHLMVVGLALLILRLLQLQVLHGADFRSLAEQNRLRVIPQHAPRGLIMDRAGRMLAANQRYFRIAAVPQDLPRVRKGPDGAKARDELFARLEKLVHVPATELADQFEKNRSAPFLPSMLVSRVTKEVALRVEEERTTLPGIIVEDVVTRRYPQGPVAAHLLGYLSKPSAEDFPVLKQYGVQPQDLVGRTGLERDLDAYLRGQAGGSVIEVNHRARQVRVLGARPTQPGQPVTLTIDAPLQQAIQERFGSRPGAAVVLQPETGEVLAMVSSPGFDPQAFAEQESETIREWLDDPESPLMNRATMGTYLPGSIVKMITGMSALENGVALAGTPVMCPGYVEFGDRRIHCWKRDGHGILHLREALMGSCNVYFMEMGRKLGLERLRATFYSAGLGHKTGWPYGEQSGQLPHRRMTEGEVAMLGIGQGGILITPIQAAVMASSIANGGWVVQPWVVKQIGDHPATGEHRTALGWSPEHVAAVRAGLYAVVNDPHGTGIRAHSEQVVIMGKTGTAQTHVRGKTHGWFAGYCPEQEPLAAFAIVAELGGSGGDLPASVGKTLCEFIVSHQAAEPAAPAAPAASPVGGMPAPMAPRTVEPAPHA